MIIITKRTLQQLTIECTRYLLHLQNHLRPFVQNWQHIHYTVSLIVSENIWIHPLSPQRIAIFPTLSHQTRSFSKDICSWTSVRLKERREVNSGEKGCFKKKKSTPVSTWEACVSILRIAEKVLVIPARRRRGGWETWQNPIHSRPSTHVKSSRK